VLKAFNELRPGETAISIITYGELVYGVTKSTQRDAGLKRLEDHSDNSGPKLAGGKCERVWNDPSRARGSRPDDRKQRLWIAAHAMAAGMTLVTNNAKEFRRVRGLKIQDWAKK
jgi:tRNA(fMet)-specific endonuclease VapC